MDPQLADLIRNYNVDNQVEAKIPAVKRSLVPKKEEKVECKSHYLLRHQVKVVDNNLLAYENEKLKQELINIKKAHISIIGVQMLYRSSFSETNVKTKHNTDLICCDKNGKILSFKETYGKICDVELKIVPYSYENGDCGLSIQITKLKLVN